MGKIVFLVILIAAVLTFFIRQNELANRLSDWQVSLDLAGFKVASFSKDTTKTSAKEELEAERDQARVKITKTIIVDHQKFIDDKKFLLASLFEPTTSPYPEVITNVIQCPEEFKPKSREVEKGTIYTLFAGERFNYGICSKDLVKYNSAYGIFDCNKKGVFEIKIFGEDEQDIKNLIQTFSC